MGDGLAVEYASVLHAAEALSALATSLAGAPAGDALRAAARAVPGGDLATAAQEEAGEWRREVADVTGALERFDRALQEAVDTYRNTDERLAR